MEEFLSIIELISKSRKDELAEKYYITTIRKSGVYTIYPIDECTQIERNQLRYWYKSGLCNTIPPDIYIYFEFGTNIKWNEIRQTSVLKVTGPVFNYDTAVVTNKIKRKDIKYAI